MILSLSVSLCLTIIIEMIVSFGLGIRSKEDFEVVLFANILTNPVVVFISNCIRLLNNNLIYNITVIIMEIIVVIVEYVLYKKYLEYKDKNPLFISSINNIISFSLGIVISKFML